MEDLKTPKGHFEKDWPLPTELEKVQITTQNNFLKGKCNKKRVRSELLVYYSSVPNNQLLLTRTQQGIKVKINKLTVGTLEYVGTLNQIQRL